MSHCTACPASRYNKHTGATLNVLRRAAAGQHLWAFIAGASTRGHSQQHHAFGSHAARLPTLASSVRPSGAGVGEGRLHSAAVDGLACNAGCSTRCQLKQTGMRAKPMHAPPKDANITGQLPRHPSTHLAPQTDTSQSVRMPVPLICGGAKVGQPHCLSVCLSVTPIRSK